MAYKPGRIDLHIHSTASDGSLRPDQILEHAVEKGLSAIAITDHDTVAGVNAALCHGIPDSLEFITGIELSAAYPPGFPNSGSMHLLGYGIRTDDSDLNRMLEKQQDARTDRNPQIIRKLNAAGIPVTMAAIIADTGKDAVARPHIAEYLVKNGYAGSINEAFDRLLGKGQPAYVDKFRVGAKEAINLIRSAGGLAVLAHPVLFYRETGDCGMLEKLVATLKSFGLAGIETYYPGQSAEQTACFETLADRFDLLVTGGTDFHGAINPEIEMGAGRGDLSIPYAIFERLKNTLFPNSRQ